MSARAVKNRQILHNITNMDDNQAEITVDKLLGGADGDLRDVNGVKSVEADLTPIGSLGAKSQGSPSCGENLNNINKFESGSGSGDHEGGHPEDGIDTAAKKRKTRRGKPKHRKLKPYSKQQISYEYRLKMRGNNCGTRVTKTGRQPPAPYNTTQFLMEDHSDLPDLEQKLSGTATGEALPVFHKPPAPLRTRDSSFSIDSDDDYFYSSPEDEEEFLTKEFSTAYEDLHAERLGELTKSELIQEYIQLESKVDLLTKRLRGRNFHQMEEREPITENKYGSSVGELELSKKLKICQQRIDDLIQQNEQLRRENDILKGQRRGSIISSVDSESDSNSSSDTSSCSCTGNSPMPSVTSANSQLALRREHSALKEQKFNGCNPANIVSNICHMDSDSSNEDNDEDDDDCNESSSHRFTESVLNSNAAGVATGNIISNGHATIQEVNGLPT